ncbi:ras GTPase-activating protein 4B isoform X6 [Meriones unguiculatus]|uniref:ras GTPase-activating protein 4B isoform X6 n=1 Tax=Meriones unguiculatus TaxID=10047 RepID=UPI00293E41F7|nr:ras GTPase-activating protein 4B isoform X6 [Meriones unguiculatus]
MAKRSSLSIRIVEGKNLPAKDITGSSDPYCIVKVDNEPIIRTATVWKTLCPFWGEEYKVHLPPTFHTVAFYVMDEDALSRDDVIGKVCLTRDMLASHPKGFSGWTHLMEVDPNEEVQGEIHLRLEVVPGTHASRLRCSVLEARDLAPKDRNGASDPFVRVHYNGRTQETSVVKKSCYPRWHETFEFELEEGAVGALLVEAWDWDLVSRNDFLGKVVVNVQRLCSAQQEEGWFQLQPDQSKSQRGQGNLGSLQLEVRLWDETVLPSIFYQPLIQLLCQEVKLGTQGPGQLISIIEETASAECRQEVATTLLKLFLGQGLAKDFLDLLFQLELSRTSEANTIFRSNSLASKSMESFLKAVQNVGNMDTAVCRTKEAWMEPLQPTVLQGVVQMKDFITKLIDIEEKEELDLQRALNSQAPPVKEGPLFIHRTKGKGPLASSFKKLYFSLTTEALSFAKTASSKKSVFIKLASIRAVEKVEEKSFGSSHVMQVIYADDVGRAQTVYLQCKLSPQCVNELNQWLSALRKVSLNNRSLLASYHPGIFRGDKWSCCHQKNKTDLGCDKTHSRVTLQEWSDPLDHDLEAQLIFRHLLGMEAALWEKYRILSGKTETGISPTGHGGAPEDPLAQLFHVLQDLRDAHSSSLAGPPPREPHRLLELQT